MQLGVTPAPLLLSCYGAYGAVETMAFNRSTLHWLERGWIRASVHARGGGLLGPAWHAAGRRGSKHVGVGDVVCCAERLLELGITTPELLCAEAGSAGVLMREERWCWVEMYSVGSRYNMLRGIGGRHHEIVRCQKGLGDRS